MKNYRIRKLQSKKYGYMIFASSFQSPLDFKAEIESDLARKGYSGNVIIDFLLSTGNKESRFLLVYFDGQKLQLNKCQKVENITQSVNTFVQHYYADNFDKLDTSILSRPTRFKLRKGYTI